MHRIVLKNTAAVKMILIAPHILHNEENTLMVEQRARAQVIYSLTTIITAHLAAPADSGPV
jgi:hypothetical protein